MPVFGRILYDLRKQHHMTQLDLAKRLGVAKSTISMYENGNRMPDYEAMEAIATCFGVDMNYLHGVKPSPEAAPQDSFVAFYGEVKDHLDEKDLEDLRTLMRLRAELHKTDT